MILKTVYSVEEDGENKGLVKMKGTYIDKVKEIKVAVVGASSTTGLMVTDMLLSR